ncbi:hypothetical protein AB0I49_04630 [Streptomyces sp. NPDC050617]|uniref:hypothetical protein n=1 Tax=Streptomyces sp. NPDC050617 TaxID=3154628 RepID=UPI003439F78B
MAMFAAARVFATVSAEVAVTSARMAASSAASSSASLRPAGSPTRFSRYSHASLSSAFFSIHLKSPALTFACQVS